MGLRAYKTILFIFLLLVIGCGKVAHHQKMVVCDVFIDSIERRAMDSIYSNVAYSRSLLKRAMAKSCDSLTYYRLFAVYSKSFFSSSDFDSIWHYNKSIERFGLAALPHPKAHDILSDVYNMEGNVFIALNKPDSATSRYKLACEHRMRGVRISFLPDIYMNLADSYIYKGEFDYAAFYYRRALFLCDSLGMDDNKKYPVYCGLGRTYMDLRDFEQSNYYYEMAARSLPEMNVREKYNYFNNRGSHYYYKKEYSQALAYMRRAGDVIKPYPQMVFERNLTKANTGELFVLSGKLDSARMCLDDSHAYFSRIGNSSAVYYIETQMIELALKEGNIPLAREMIERTASSNHLEANMISIRNQYLQNYFEQVGDYKRAYEYQKKELNLNDSVRNERIQARVAELDMRYRQDTIVMRKEVQIERQTGEMKALRLSVYIWILVCLALLAGVGGLFWYMRKKREFMQERFLQQINKARMESIRSNVLPHFTFNVLGREISHFKGDEEDRSGLVELVQLLRKSLELSGKLGVSLHDELEFVKMYVHLEQERLEDNFTMAIVVDDGVDLNQVTIPSMIIQIPVENAIKHGFADLVKEKKLTITVSRQKAGMKILICDNGNGYQPQIVSSTRGTGTGLKVLYQTIQLLNAKNRGERITFEITNIAGGQETGTQVSVYVPCNYSYIL